MSEFSDLERKRRGLVVEEVVEPIVVEEEPRTSWQKASLTGAKNSIGGTVGSLGTGAIVGSLLAGTGIGTIPGLAILGGSALIGGMAGNEGQEMLEPIIRGEGNFDDYLNDRVSNTTQLRKLQEMKQAEEQPIANTVGGLAGSLVAMRPSIQSIKDLAGGVANLTRAGAAAPSVAQTIAMQNAVVNSGSGVIGSAYNDINAGEYPSLKNAVIGALTGALINEPNAVGRAMGFKPSIGASPNASAEPITLTEDIGGVNPDVNFTSAIGPKRPMSGSLVDEQLGLNPNSVRTLALKSAPDSGVGPNQVIDVENYSPNTKAAAGQMELINKAQEPYGNREVDFIKAKKELEQQRLHESELDSVEADIIKGKNIDRVNALSAELETPINKPKLPYEQPVSSDLRQLQARLRRNPVEEAVVPIDELSEVDNSNTLEEAAKLNETEPLTEAELLERLHENSGDRYQDSQDFDQFGKKLGTELSKIKPVTKVTKSGKDYQAYTRDQDLIDFDSISLPSSEEIVRPSRTLTSAESQLIRKESLTPKLNSNLVNPETGNEAYGVAKVGSENRDIELNPKYVPDTVAHEAAHHIVGEMLNNPKLKPTIEKWMKVHGDEESLVSAAGKAWEDRTVKNTEGSFKSFAGDLVASVRSKIGKGSKDDVARLLSSKLIKDASFSEREIPKEPTVKPVDTNEEKFSSDSFSKELESDIKHKINTAEESLDEGETLQYTREDAIRELMQDMDEPEHYAFLHKKELEDFAIKESIYKPYTKEQLSQIQVSSGRKYDFKRGDKYYRFEGWGSKYGQKDSYQDSTEQLNKTADAKRFKEIWDTIIAKQAKDVDYMGSEEGLKLWKEAESIKNKRGGIEPDKSKFQDKLSEVKEDTKSGADKYQDINLIPKPLRPEVDKIAEKGAGGKVIADKATSFYEQFRANRGKFVNSISRELLKNVNKLNPKELVTQNNETLDNVRSYMDDVSDSKTPSVTLNDKEQSIVGTIREHLKNIRLEQNSKTNLRTGGIDPNYFPQVVSRSVLDTIINKPESADAQRLIQDFYDYYASQKKSVKDADDSLKEFRGGYTKRDVNIAEQFGPIDKAEGIGIPQSWREKNLIDRLARYSERVSRRFAYADTIGLDDTVHNLLVDPKVGLNGAEPVKHVFNDIYGYKPMLDSKTEQLLMGLSGIIRAGRLGPLSGYKDLRSSFALGMQHQHSTQVIHSMADAISNFKRNMESSYEAGVNRVNIGSLEMGDTENSVLSVLQTSRDVLNAVQGRNYLEKVTRAINYGQGQWLVNDNWAAQGKGKSNSQQNKFLKDFGKGLDLQKYTGKELPKEVVMEMASRYVESVQGSYDFRGLPSVTTHGMLAPIFSLARWNFEKLNNFQKYVVTPATKGNFKPLLLATLGTMVSGALLEKEIEVITNKKSKLPTNKEIEFALKEKDGKGIAALTYRLAGLASMSGFGGMSAEVLKGAMDIVFKNKPQAYGNIAIEGVSDAGGLALDIVEAVENGDLNIVAGVLETVLTDYLQSARLIAAHLDEDTVQQSEDSDKRRDLKMFKNLTDRKVGDVSDYKPNKFLNPDIRKFKTTTSLEEAKELAPEIKNDLKAKAKSKKEYYKELGNAKRNSFQTMPNPEEDYQEFKSYEEYLKETQGEDEAKERVKDYKDRNKLNRKKSGLL